MKRIPKPMITRKQILHYASKLLLTLTGYALRALYRCLYGRGRYREFRLNTLLLGTVLRGVTRNCMSPTRETDARNREIERAVNTQLFENSGDVLDKLAKKKFGKVPKDYHLHHP